MRVLRRISESVPDERGLSEEVDDSSEISESQESIAEEEKSILRRDASAWFRTRFPTVSAFMGWLLPAVAYALMYVGYKGRSVSQAFLTVAAFYPVVLQTFWVPGLEIEAFLRKKPNKLPTN